MNRLNAKYKNEVVPSLIEKFNYKSVMEVPKVENGEKVRVPKGRNKA